ncbi:hypothetical protein [Hymenobacter chitinivorans]|uniref:Uncharacterized protein n=1 Tax=Hymenobacter chitinivorans DSM 11115 TaxID=1121954 RepID=A0A2M9BKZ2_9BACT|nr:hypothetical protein [Hymenobacter chitinivorans]PJJ58618.1 hypothetical protein CLV45_0028 [Hymenobacter chitinivorans DSM 11115]
MGGITCPIHGPSGFYELCEHIHRDFNNGVIPERRYLPVCRTQLCTDCYYENNVKEIPYLTYDEILSLPKEEYLILEDRIRTVYNAINRRHICANCFKQVQIIDAKTTGKELPFEAFENTLMYKDKETIEALEQILKYNYKFKQTINHFTNTFERNWHIMGGEVSSPLSITFYYINKDEDQNKILTLINNFLKIFLKNSVKSFFTNPKTGLLKKEVVEPEFLKARRKYFWKY